MLRMGGGVIRLSRRRSGEVIRDGCLKDIRLCIKTAVSRSKCYVLNERQICSAKLRSLLLGNAYCDNRIM